MALRLAIAADTKLAKKPGPSTTPSPAPSVNIRIDLLMVSMPEDKFITLLPDLLDKEKIEKAVPDLLEAVKRKEMILEGYQIITTKSGQRAVAETVKEVRYPTEPATHAAPPDAPVQNAPDAAAAVHNFQPAATPGGRSAAGYTPVDPTTPMDYETRNCGMTLEVEPVASPDGQSIDLNLAPQQVQLLGFLNTPGLAKNEDQNPKDDSRPVSVTQSPLFYTMKDTTSVTLHNGQHMLLGVHKTAQPEGNIEVFIIYGEILPKEK